MTPSRQTRHAEINTKILIMPRTCLFQFGTHQIVHWLGALTYFLPEMCARPLSFRSFRAYTQAYRACVSATDANVGALIGTLKDLSIWDSTVVLLWSDHGFKLGDHGLWLKVLCGVCGGLDPLYVSSSASQRNWSQRRVSA